MKMAGTKSAFKDAYDYATRNRVDLVSNANNMFRTIARVNPLTICVDCDVEMKIVESHYKPMKFKGDGSTPPDYEIIWTKYRCLICGEEITINK